MMCKKAIAVGFLMGFLVALAHGDAEPVPAGTPDAGPMFGDWRQSQESGEKTQEVSHYWKGVKGRFGGYVTIDVTRDLKRLYIYSENAVADDAIDDTGAFQAAIDYVSYIGAGNVVVPAGVFRLRTIKIVNGVNLTGAGREKTTLRALEHIYALIELNGGSVQNLSVYGTSEEGSGDNWKVGTGGTGKYGSARPAHNIYVNHAPDGVLINNVHSFEARYDTLYVCGVNGLGVYNSQFDRAGRNIVSIVGNTDNFVFANCTIGSLWGLYNFDIEPNAKQYARNGLITNCIFDGSKAGEMNTDTWGSFLGFCGSHGKELLSYNVSVVNCHFKDIWVRCQGVVPKVQFIGNTFANSGAAFVRVRTNPVGEFRDAVVRGNRFTAKGAPSKTVVYGVSFTGNTVVEDNWPEGANAIVITDKSKDHGWQEVHPLTQKTAAGEVKVTVKEGVTEVIMPLAGHVFRFSDNEVSPYQKYLKTTIARDKAKLGDLIMHLDPFIAVGKAGLVKIGTGKLEDFGSSLAREYQGKLFGVTAGDVLAIRTNAGKEVLVQIIELSRIKVRFRYRYVSPR